MPHFTALAATVFAPDIPTVAAAILSPYDAAYTPARIAAQSPSILTAVPTSIP
jgi:hypothetical protein